MKPIIFITVFLSGMLLFAQPVEHEMEALVETGEAIMMSPERSTRDSAQVRFRELLIDVLESSSNAFALDFTEVKNLSVLDSDDDNLRVFTWLVPGMPGTEAFHGLIMLRKKKNDFTLIALDDHSDSLQGPEYRPLTPSQWYGALYYQLFTVTNKKDTYHMLMGYKPVDDAVQQKIIDVIHIDGHGILRFGAKIFETPKLMDWVYQRPPYRLFFNYSARVAASFRYRTEEGMIVLDHLSPPEGTPHGQWQLYGPDFSYDGLEFVKGRWVLREDIQVESGVKQPLPNRAPRKDPQTGKVPQR